MENTRENCDKLAQRVVEDMDLKEELMCVMTEIISDNYFQDKDGFERDWEHHIN